ncbi:hypothetical protein AOLI_G00043530 [Acnodon oligacanthus]
MAPGPVVQASAFRYGTLSVSQWRKWLNNQGVSYFSSTRALFVGSNDGQKSELRHSSLRCLVAPRGGWLARSSVERSAPYRLKLQRCRSLTSSPVRHPRLHVRLRLHLL